MDTRVFSVYNLAREVLLNSKLKRADSAHQPLKLLDQLISGLGLGADSGLWLLPVTSTPLIPRVFPFDFAYLDKENRVLHAVEIGPGIEFPPYGPNVASALLLPSGKLLSSKTSSGDCLVICPAEELEGVLAASRTSVTPNSTISAAPEKAPTPKSTRKKPPLTTADRDLAPAVAQPALENTASAPSTQALAAAISSEKVTVSRNSARTSAKTPFEQAILDAIAKADNPEPQTEVSRAAIEVPAAADQVPAARAADSSVPLQPELLKPAASSVGGAADRARTVPPAIVELHADPEDLFSNWVVTPSVAPAWATENALASPEMSKPHEQHPTTLKSESTSPGAPTVGPRTSPGIPTAPVPETAVRSNTSRSIGPPSAPQPPAVSSRGTEIAPTAPPKSPTPAPGIGIPQISTVTTFSAVPYAMWQVRTPTAVPLGSPAKSPSKSNPVAIKSSPETVQPESGKATASSPTMAASPVSAASSQSTKAPESTRLASAQPTVPARRSTDRPPETPSRPTPAQFRSSVQERLERLQQTHAHDFNPAQAEPTTQPMKSPSGTPAVLDSGSAPHVWPSSSAPQSVAVKSGAVLAKNASPDAKASAPPPQIPKPQTSAMRVETAVTTEPPRTTLKSKFKKWLNPTPAPSDRRRAARRYVPGMIAHYFTGGAPKPHSVADISMTGFYLLTEDRWMPGTMIQMTLQKPCAKGERKQSITVLSRIVRRGSDGVATEFVMPGTLDPYSHEVPASQATDKFALARFL